jgi:hypothetical protein
MRRCACLIVIASVIASAAYADGDRVVIADPDPELQRAIVTTLAPWRLEVLVEPKPPADIEDAKVRAGTSNARFVVWRHGRDLLVFDRDRDAVEQRATSAGTLDDAHAAQAALTVKTLMRLPPPPPPEGEGSGSDVVITPDAGVGIGSAVAPVPSKGLEIRVQVGAEGHLDSAASGLRASLVATVRPTASPWRVGAFGDLGPRSEVSQAGFRGEWTHSTVLGLASWTFELDRIEVEPFLGAGITGTLLDGTESTLVRREREVLPTGRAGTWIRLPLGPFSIGGSVAVDALLGAPTYIKQGGGGMPEIFAVPMFSFSIGVFAAAAFEP